MTDEVPDGLEVAIFGLGCFWGAEEIYWQLPRRLVDLGRLRRRARRRTRRTRRCAAGRTGHTEAVRIVFDPEQVSYADLVKRFFEVHDPTQGMRQGNDVGTQYRSAIYVTTPEQEQTARELTTVYGEEFARRGLGEITTEIAPGRRPTTTPSRTTSSTSRRTRSATAATPTPGCRSRRSLTQPPLVQGSTVTLIASPFLTIEKASRTSASGMCRVIRSLTGTCPVEMYSSARLLCSGAEPLAPWMCSWR